MVHIMCTINFAFLIFLFPLQVLLEIFDRNTASKNFRSQSKWAIVEPNYIYWIRDTLLPRQRKPSNVGVSFLVRTIVMVGLQLALHFCFLVEAYLFAT